MAKVYVGAIDCSFNFCGCAILRYERAGAKPRIEITRLIKNPPLKKSGSLMDIDRACILYSGVKSFMNELMDKGGNKVFAFEVPTGSQSQRAAACLGMAKGVIASVLSQQMFEDIAAGSWMRAPIMPSEVHKVVTGKLKATKEEVMDYVTKLYPDQIKQTDKKFAVYNHFPNDASTVDRYNKGEFEHIADALVLAELGYRRLKG